MPVEHPAAALRVPVPLHLLPQPGDPPAQRLFSWSVAVEVLPGAQQPHAQEGGLDEVAAIILAEERNASQPSVHS